LQTVRVRFRFRRFPSANCDVPPAAALSASIFPAASLALQAGALQENPYFPGISCRNSAT
jgi:hypothetical protein